MLLLPKGLVLWRRLKDTADEQVGFPYFPVYLQFWSLAHVVGLVWDAAVGIIHACDVCYVNCTRVKLPIGIQLKASLVNFRSYFFSSRLNIQHECMNTQRAQRPDIAATGGCKGAGGLVAV